MIAVRGYESGEPGNAITMCVTPPAPAERRDLS